MYSRLVNEILPKFIYIIIFFKIVFLFLIFFHVFFLTLGKNSANAQYYDDKLVKLIHQSDFVFKFLMAFLLIFIFYPKRDNMKFINTQMKFLFFLFGIILLLTADWSTFFKESNVYKKILKGWQ